MLSMTFSMPTHELLSNIAACIIGASARMMNSRVGNLLIQNNKSHSNTYIEQIMINQPYIQSNLP
jgi:hypothetical protein